MTLGYLGLALAMFAVTYPARALPLLVPGADRLPPRVTAYLRLVGPSMLAALAVTTVAVDGATRSLRLGVPLAAVALCAVLVRTGRSLALGLAAAAALVATARALGLA